MKKDSVYNTVYFSNLWPEENQERFDELQSIIEGAG